MTSTQHTHSDSAGTGAVHLLLKQGEMEFIVENPDKVIDELRARAEQVGSVLENILSQAHAESPWGHR